jgi:hypothetical protein
MVLVAVSMIRKAIVDPTVDDFIATIRSSMVLKFDSNYRVSWLGQSLRFARESPFDLGLWHW